MPPPTAPAVAGHSKVGSMFIGFCSVIAQCLNRLRVVPRFIVGGYGYLIWVVAQWYMSLPDPNTQQAALITTLVGISVPVFGFYMQGGITAGAIAANGKT